MVTLITGCPGSGKTKQLVKLVHQAVDSSNGNVVCIEKKRKLTYEVSSRVRLIAADDYAIRGYDNFYGFLAGICAGDHDITDIFIDATLRIVSPGPRDYDELLAFLRRAARLAKETDTKFVFTISADVKQLPEATFEICTHYAETCHA